MRRLIISTLFVGLLPFSPANANVADDLAAQMSANDVLNNALLSCFNGPLEACPSAKLDQLMLEVASVDTSLLDSFVTAAIDNGFNAGDIVRAAIQAGANPEEIAQVAILAGADPTDVAEATAAGGTIITNANGLPTTPNGFPLPPFGNNNGGGGGGNTSPS